jgi:hypothetical protein
MPAPAVTCWVPNQGEIVGGCGGTCLDKDLAMVPKMNEVFALGSAEYISLWRCGLSLGHTFRQYLADAEAPQAEQQGSAFLVDCVHDNLL